MDNNNKVKPPSFRIGHGFDVHKLVKERKLILCGEVIAYEYGLLGHSDADVASHALSDALLGALALGDIGKHFPDTDPAYSGADSIVLLRHVYDLVLSKGYALVNCDIIIAAQKPKLMPFIENMRKNIADALSTGLENVSVKATTTEGLGFEGRCEGISATAVCLITMV